MVSQGSRNGNPGLEVATALRLKSASPCRPYIGIVCRKILLCVICEICGPAKAIYFTS